MTTDAVRLWFALLALVAEGAAVAILAVHLTRHRRVLADHVGPSALALAFAVALVATVGSIYLSETRARSVGSSTSATSRSRPRQLSGFVLIFALVTTPRRSPL